MRFSETTFGLVAVSLLMIFGFSTVSNAGDNAADLQALIDETSAKLTKATLANDGEAMLGFYTEDAVSMPNYSPMLRGKDAIRTYGEEMDKMGFIFGDMDFRTSDLWSCDELVYELGNYTVAFSIGDTSVVMKEHGKYMTIWEQQDDGSLKIKVETWNADSYPCGN